MSATTLVKHPTLVASLRSDLVKSTRTFYSPDSAGYLPSTAPRSAHILGHDVFGLLQTAVLLVGFSVLVSIGAWAGNLSNWLIAATFLALSLTIGGLVALLSFGWRRMVGQYQRPLDGVSHAALNALKLAVVEVDAADQAGTPGAQQLLEVLVEMRPGFEELFLEHSAFSHAMDSCRHNPVRGDYQEDLKAAQEPLTEELYDIAAEALAAARTVYSNRPDLLVQHSRLRAVPDVQALRQRTENAQATLACARTKLALLTANAS